MGLALWHFTVFLPDRCWAGIIGAFLGCVFGAIVFGLAIHGLAIPGQDETDLLTTHGGRPRRAAGLRALLLARIAPGGRRRAGGGRGAPRLTGRPPRRRTRAGIRAAGRVLIRMPSAGAGSQRIVVIGATGQPAPDPPRAARGA